MKRLPTLGFVLFTLTMYAQTNTEVYLLDISESNGKIALKNLRNISNNEGYDNQPSFYDNNTVLFSSTRDGQTDIAKYDITLGQTSWVTDTGGGSEYSPLRVPNSNDISAVRLDTTGLQRLYKYDMGTGKSKELLENQKVGYHVWLNATQLFTSVLVEDRMDLLFTNLEEKTDTLIMKNVGRSLHKVPNNPKDAKKSSEIGFMANYKKSGMIETYNPVTKKFKELVGIKKELQDYCWLQDGSILIPERNQLLRINPTVEDAARPFHSFNAKKIYKISRITVSPDGKHMALVSEEPPSKIVQKQVDSYNAGDLEAFVNCYAENVLVTKFPADTLYVGHKKMRQNYNGLSPERITYTVEVVKRIVIGNKVIDQEKVTGTNRVSMQVAAYEVTNDKIDSMTFIFDTDAPDPETIVQKQLNAYNAKDIEGFLKTFTEDVLLYDFPAEKRSQGQDEMRKGYSGFFDSTPDLHCELKNRIVIGNKVIDEEYITANGANFSAVAIYEVENGKIAKVTFLR